MHKHISCPPRAIATISGYRRICADLESENLALKLQNLELRAQLRRDAASTLDGREDFEHCGIAAASGEVERLKWSRLM